MFDYVITSRTFGPITHIYNVKHKNYTSKYKMYLNEHPMHGCNVLHRDNTASKLPEEYTPD